MNNEPQNYLNIRSGLSCYTLIILFYCTLAKLSFAKSVSELFNFHEMSWTIWRLLKFHQHRIKKLVPYYNMYIIIDNLSSGNNLLKCIVRTLLLYNTVHFFARVKFF